MTINTAVIGCGPASRNQHIPAIKLNPKARLVGLSDIDENALQQAQVDDVATYTDVEDMLDDQDIDSVHIVTPPDTRVGIAEKVMPRGVNVLFEKPIATSVEEVEKLQKLASEYEVTTSVVHNKLFTPHFIQAKEQIKEGEIGEVVATDMIYGSDMDLSDTHRDDWVFELPGGEIGEGLPHRVYMALEFSNNLGSVECVTHRNLSNETDVELDGVDIELLDQTGDQLISIRILTNTLNRENLTVYGTDGELIVDNNLQSVRTSNFENMTAQGLVRESLDQAAQYGLNMMVNAFGYAKRTVYRQMNDPRGEYSNSHYVLIDRYLDSVTGDSAPPVTLEEAKSTIEVLEAVDQAL